jgi:pSer/pThr/pTyr-binding forkhead associated (FHA) protein
MALLEMGGKKFTIPAGEVLLGSDAGCAIQLTGPGLLPQMAVLKGLPDGQVAIRRAAPDAVVKINGVKLGAEPTPLLHGDKVEAGGHELTFVDERRSGSTQMVSAMNVPQMMAEAKAKAGGKATGNTGGRVVSLTDGREYAITGATLVFGREAGCDVVVTGKDVSRRHAEIMSTAKGYVVVDSSTNGTFVNEARIEGQRVLMRADVIRIGDEQFRFYADAAPAAVPPPVGPAANSPQAAPPAPSAPATPSGAGQRLQNTSFGMSAAPRPPASAPAAPAAFGNLLFRTGAMKGQRYQIKAPIINIGRAEYNDLNISDESVSTSHAKLQRREGVWMLVDLDSTNGTFVDGERVQGEAPLAPGAVVRFGDVQLVFEPTDDAMGTAKGGGTKMIEAFKAPAAKAAPAVPPAPPAAKPAAPAKAAPTTPKAPPAAPKPPAKRPAPAPPPEKKGKGCGASAAVVMLSSVAALYWMLS